MTYAKVFSADFDAVGGVNQTDAVNSTGADLIVLAVSYYGPDGPPSSITDNKSNTWTALTQQEGASGGVRMYYCQAPTVGSGHVFTVGIYGSVFRSTIQAIGF